MGRNIKLVMLRFYCQVCANLIIKELNILDEILTKVFRVNHKLDDPRNADQDKEQLWCSG